MSFKRRTPFTSQPQQPVGIDWSNPITRNIVGTCATGLLVDAFGVRIYKSSDVLAPAATGGGILLGGFNASAYATASHPKITGATGLSAAFTLRYTSGAANRTYLAQGGAGTGGGGWNIGSQASANNLRFTLGGVAEYLLMTPFVSGNVYRVLVVSSGNGGTATAYVNGVQGAVVAIGTMAAASTSTIIGAVHDGTSYVAPMESGSAIGDIVLYARALSLVEARADFEKRWQIFSHLNRNIYVEAAGGTAFTQAVTGALAFVGARSSQTGKPLAANLSLAGAISRFTSRQLAATSAFIGVLARAFPVAFTAALAFSGAVARRTARPISAAVSFVGATAKRTSRALSAALSFVGATAKRTSRAVSGVLSFIGAVAFVRLITVALAATLSFIGTRTHISGKVFSAVLNTAGTVARRTARPLSAALAFVGGTAKLTGRALSGALSFVGAITPSRLFARALSATLAFTGTTSKRTARVFSAALALAGAVASVLTSSVISVALSATLAFTGAHRKRTARPLAATLSFIGATNKRISRAFAAAVAFIGNLLGSIFVVNLPQTTPEFFVLRVTRETFVQRLVFEPFVQRQIFETLIIR